MKASYNALRMPDLSALAREHELRGYYRLRKAELIAFLSFDLCLLQDPLRKLYLFQDLLRNLYLLQNLLLHNRLSVNQNAPDLRNLQDLLPPPHEEDFGKLSGGLIRVSESMEGVGWMCKPSLRKLEEVSLT